MFQRGIFVRNRSDSTRSDGYKLKEEEFRLGITNKFFTLNRLPRDSVDPSNPGLEQRGVRGGVPWHEELGLDDL